MLASRIQELEILLATATASLASMTVTNLGLKRELDEQARRSKKLRRGARRDKNAFALELASARSGRG